MAYDKKKLEQFELGLAETEKELEKEFRAAMKANGHSGLYIDDLVKKGAHLDPANFGYTPGSTNEVRLGNTFKDFKDRQGRLRDTANWDKDPSFGEPPKSKGFIVTDAEGKKTPYTSVAEIEADLKNGRLKAEGSFIVDQDNPSTGAVALKDDPALAGSAYDQAPPKRPRTIGEAVEVAGGSKEKADKYRGVKLRKPGENRVGRALLNFAQSPAATIEAALTGQMTDFESWAHEENMKAGKLGKPAPFPDVKGKPASKGGFQQYMDDGIGFGARGLNAGARGAARGLWAYGAGEALGGLRAGFQDENSTQSLLTPYVQSLYGLGKEGVAALDKQDGFLPGLASAGLNTLTGIVGAPLTGAEQQFTKDNVAEQLRLENKSLTAKERANLAKEILTSIGEIDPSRASGGQNLGPASISRHLMGIIDPKDFTAQDGTPMTRSMGITTDLLREYGGAEEDMYDDLRQLVETGKGKLGGADVYAQRASTALQLGKSKFKGAKDKVIPLYGIGGDNADPDEEYFLVSTPSGYRAIRANTKTGEVMSGNGGDLRSADQEYKAAEEAYKKSTTTAAGRGIKKTP